MAVSKLKTSSVLLTERYFNIVYTRFNVDFPADADWKDVEIPELPNGLSRQILMEVPYALVELANIFDDARVESMIPRVERLRLNNGNLYSQYMNTITQLLDNGLSWGKVVVFFAFSVSVAIFLCTHELDKLAARVCVWAAQVLESRLQPWIDANKGWVSDKDLLFLCLSMGS